MTSRKLSFLSFSALLLAVSPCLALAQNDLPSAPAPAAAKPANPFALPPATPHNAPPPEEPATAEPLVCGAPATGIYGKHVKDTPEQNRAIRDYVDLVSESVTREWRRRMPRSASNVWARGKIVQIRFAIMPDGSYDPAIVTISSGHNDWDVHAASAVNSYANFPTPPQVGHPIILCIHFGYNTDGSLTKPKTPDLWPPPQKPSGDASSKQ